jgi:equilibrative nucleoside transporter 1/2/3
MPGSRLFFINRSKVLFGLTMLRLCFVPCFLFGNAKSIYSVMYGDEIFFLLVLFLGLSNGFLITNSLMLAPRLMSSSSGQRVGDVMVLSIALGLGGGSLLSFAVRAVLCGCDPFT